MKHTAAFIPEEYRGSLLAAARARWLIWAQSLRTGLCYAINPQMCWIPLQIFSNHYTNTTLTTP